MSASPANCHVFQDGRDWLVFAPVSGLLLRTNRSKAAEFEACVGRTEGPSAASAPEGFGWSDVESVVVACGNHCRLRCRYCLSSDEGLDIMPDVEFCRLALREILNASRGTGPLPVAFTGMGEPTIPWGRFTECVAAVEGVAEEFGRELVMSICTDGQMEGPERSWLCGKMRHIDVSLDGPPAVQNLQRPRKDGDDSYACPSKLVAEALAAGQGVRIRSTITGETVRQMPQFVDFFADAFGERIEVVFSAMMDLEAAPGGCSSPEPDLFAKNFGAALDRGTVRGLQVRHAVVSVPKLLQDAARASSTIVCLLSNRTVARHIEPFWLSDARRFPSSVFARYEPRLGRLALDARRHRELFEGVVPRRCGTCPCVGACAFSPSAWGWNETHPGDRECEVRRGVMREILRRVV